MGTRYTYAQSQRPRIQLPDAGRFSTKSKSIRDLLIDSIAHKFETEEMRTITYADPADWVETNHLVHRPRMPGTGAVLPPGPIRLAAYQKVVLREMLRRDTNNQLMYSTMLWSEPKKSGKTEIAAAVSLYIAQHTPSSYIYLLANDGKQSQDRLFRAVDKCIKLHNSMGGIFHDLTTIWSPPTLKMHNGTVLEAIPCDPSGEAGSEPLATFWSEIWGYKQDAKSRLWTEMTIPPTLEGIAFRWCESYAGYTGDSPILEQMYDEGVTKAKRHPDFPDYPLYVNDRAGMIAFWNEEPRPRHLKQPWHTNAYYAKQKSTLTESEFKRIHQNKWVSAAASLFDDDVAWNKCIDPIASQLKAGDKHTPIVVAIDASINHDCCAMLGVRRHPDDKWDTPTRRVVECYVGVWYPEPGEKIDYSKTLEPAIRWLVISYNVYEFVYDPYQLHKMCTDMKNEGLASFKEFSQGPKRAIADKQFFDMIRSIQYLHSGHPETTYHMRNTAQHAEGRWMRFVQKSSGKPIDLMVVGSMATQECLRLNL